MKFSLFYEMQIADPTPASETETFRACVEQAVLAEKLGFHGIWAVEHHGLYEYSHSSAPEIFLSFVAARTERIRIGHGVTLLPHRYNHPIRVAERIAALDILSGGRVDFGTGKSSSAVEQGAFEADPAALSEQWLEALRAIPEMWESDVFEFKGKYLDVPPTQIVPKPVQRPHPPIYCACTGPESATTAGRLGLGALNFSLGSDDYLMGKVTAYREAIAAAEPVAKSVVDHFACAPPALVLSDDRRACEYGFRGARFFASALSRYYLGRERPTGRLPVERGFLSDAELAAAMRNRTAPGAANNACIGDPSAAKEFVQRFVELGVDELIFIMQMGTVPLELVTESVRTFGEKVLPHFA
ncbi:MAG TPA: LLM class flavin-dependent oxidoreductase [Polyangiaceae bacterium]|nr:LLM class flavin-dependent oxidoreductase [Polyangiaceae bacterium]